MAMSDLFYKQKGYKKPRALTVKPTFTKPTGPSESALIKGDAERYREHVKRERQALGLE